MIVKAIAETSSCDDPNGRVVISSPNIWVGLTDFYVPVINAVPINKGDVLFVLVEDLDFQSPIVLGRCRDNNFTSNANIPSDFSVLFESVNQSKGTWTVAYVSGGKMFVQNDKGMVLSVESGEVTVHEGLNGGVVNVAPVRSLVQALVKDLAAVGSGANLISWMASDYSKLEDSNFKH